MVTFTIAPPKDVRTAGTGVVKTYIAGARIPFGAAVIRAGAGTVQPAVLEDTNLIMGFALEDERTHTYPGFYEQYEPVPVAISGTINALLASVDGEDLVTGDYLEHIDLTSGTMASGVGVLAEAGSAAGNIRTTSSAAKLLEDVDMTATYKTPTSATAGGKTIGMTSGDPTLMGLHVGDYIIIRDSDGTTAQVNRVTAVADTSLTTLIPITVAAADLIHAVRQAEVLIL